MNDMYLKILKRIGDKSQWDIFSKITRGCNNIVVLKGDSKQVEIPSRVFCFGFIDGNHHPSYIENDFYLVWNKLFPGGCIAFHDYRFDLPCLTQKIDELIKKHAACINETFYDKDKHVIFLKKQC